MSIHHLEAAATLEGMSPSKKLAFMAICDDADKMTGLGAPGLEAVHKWSGITSKSQVLAVIAELVEEGYIERVSPGRKGRKAVFRVFAQIACCALHAAPNAPQQGSGQPDPMNPNSGSGQPDPSTSIGSGKGSGPDRTPPVSPEKTPLPPPSGGAVATTDTPTSAFSWHPGKCTRHPDAPGINCRACETSPRTAVARHTKAAAAAARRAEAERFRNAAAIVEAERSRPDHKPTVRRSLAEARAEIARQNRDRKAAG